MIKSEIQKNGQFKVDIEGSEEDLMLETLCIIKTLSVFSNNAHNKENIKTAKAINVETFKNNQNIIITAP